MNSVWSILILCTIFMVSFTISSPISALITDFFKLKHVGILYLQTCDTYSKLQVTKAQFKVWKLYIYN